MVENALHIIIVTYNNRWSNLSKVLNQLQEIVPNVSIYIIINGGDIPSEDYFDKYNFKSLNFLYSGTNKGSAWAFKKGIEYVVDIKDSELILFLDDDNLVNSRAIQILQQNWNNYKSENRNDSIALLALRVQRNYLFAVAAGGSVKSQFPQNNEFLGFGKRLFLNKVLKPKTNANLLNHPIQIPCAPYGGLFFHKALIAKIGMPDVRFFVYADDFEFTYRITKNEGSIFLIPDAKIEDIEESWQVKPSRSLFTPKFLFPENPLIYISIRNFVYFQSRNLVTSRFLFTINRFLYSLFLLVIAIFTLRINAFNRYWRAVSDGLKGRFDNNFYIK